MTKFFSYLKTIIIHPGDISYDFINGRLVSFRVPVIAFLIANALYVAVPARSDLYAQMNNMPYSHVAKEMVDQKIKSNKTNLKKFTVAYDQRSNYIGKAVLVVTVFFFSFALLVVNYRMNLKYIDHLAVSFEFMALATLYILMLMVWIDVLILTLIAAVLLLYAFERMTYRWRPFRAMANAALLVFLFLGTQLLYRASVFFITMLTF